MYLLAYLLYSVTIDSVSVSVSVSVLCIHTYILTSNRIHTYVSVTSLVVDVSYVELVTSQTEKSRILIIIIPLVTGRWGRRHAKHGRLARTGRWVARYATRRGQPICKK